jgi:tRNA (adenine22-N1)-methyltransferase
MQISGRLSACAELVRQGAVLADIGTDHAYLPIYLLKKGRIKFAHLSDINEGPLSKAAENARSEGVTDMTALHLTSGAAALSGLGITDYCICGMGGELIAEIIGAAPALFDTGVNLILQPMTRPEALRAFLYDNGFTVKTERYVFDEGKYYVIILAAFTGEREEYTDADAYFGKSEFFEKITDSMKGYLLGRRRALLKRARGISSGGGDPSREEYLLSELDKRASGIL